MNVKLKKRNNSEVDSAAIEKIAANLSLHPKFVEILFSRGINSENDIIRFLSSDSDGLHDPFKMKGMSKAVERLKSAVENDETVVVYGDYDADGICAAAILSLYLRACGLDVRTHIPNRIGDGYGLNISSLEKIIEDVDKGVFCICKVDEFHIKKSVKYYMRSSNRHYLYLQLLPLSEDCEYHLSSQKYE